LKKYGIEPLQPLQSAQSQVKQFPNEQKIVTTYTTNSSFKNEPSQIQNTTYQNNNYNQQPKVENHFVEQKPNDGNKFQNYSEILRNYEEKKPSMENQDGPKRYGFEPENYQNRYEEKPPGYFVENRYEPENFQRQYEEKPPSFYAETKQNPYEAVEKPRQEFSRERKEIAKRQGFEGNVGEEMPPQNLEPIQYNYEYKPKEMVEYNNSIDFYSNYNKPSDIELNAQMNSQPKMGGPSQNFTAIQTRIETNAPNFQQQQKPSLYDNVSFANEFFETKTHETKHDELKKKSSINEMKKSINNPGKYI